MCYHSSHSRGPAPVSPRQALERLAALCSRGEQCTHDLAEKMRRWQLSAADIAAVLDELTRERFVDDERYARSFINDKLRFNRWGPVKIALALRQKGIGPDVVTPLLRDLGDEPFLAILRDLLREKERTIVARTPYELRAKLIRFAAGRGFPPSLVQQCVEDGE